MGVGGFTADATVGVGNASGAAVGVGELTAGAPVGGGNVSGTAVGATPLTVDSALGVGTGCMLEEVSSSDDRTVDSIDSEVVEERLPDVSSAELDVNGAGSSD